MTITEKARIADEIEAFNNTDFSDCPELTDDQLTQLRPSHYRKTALILAAIEQNLDWLYSEAESCPSESQIKNHVESLRKNTRELAAIAGAVL
jgi:hypothetical protein